MKLLFEQNLSPRLVRLLAAEFPGSGHVIPLGLDGAPDPTIWAFAAANGFAVGSKDADFQTRSAALGHPPKVVWVRFGNCPTAAVAAALRARLSDLLAFDADPALALIEVS
ncbi:MAG: DUF5615 family PIN-like protein [Gemmataceae bacterium]|nr:DUF5615 family PIN-like protein [Gemmataceae bacterium]